MKKEIAQHFQPALTPLTAFLLPCALMISVFAMTGIYPFGEKSLLIIDMSNEYVDYLAQMNESVRTGGSLLRTWNMGMGLNMLGLIAFYTSSPFNLLVMAFPVSHITEVLFFITVAKIGLAGLNFSLYTGWVMEKRGLFAILFSTAYALCGYNIAYASNIMWLDGAAFLPLVLLGVERLLRENRMGVLFGSLVYIFFTSYYIAYMIGVFAFLYLTCIWFSEPRTSAVRAYFIKLLRLLGAAALAAGCCAFLLLPAFFVLKNGQSEMWQIQIDPAFNRSLVRIASRLLPGVYNTLTDSGYPNIYCSVLAVLLTVCFFTHREIPRRKKWVFAGLLFFLFISFSCEILDLAWHAFEDPTWFPARYSFVFSFLLLYLAMHAAKNLTTLPASGMAVAVVVLFLLLVEIGIGRYPFAGMRTLLTAAALTGLYAGLWIIWKRFTPHSAARRFCAAAALLLLCAETWGNALVTERGLDQEFGYKTRDSYLSYRETYAPAVAAVAEIDPGIHRMEIVEQRNANGGMALGYKGISHYSTTTDQALNAFLRQLGYNRGTENELRFAVNSPLTNGLLGIRYVLSKHDLGPGYSLQKQVGAVGIYENRYALPLAFWAEESALSYTMESRETDPFLLQNQLTDALGLGNRIFVSLPDVEERPYNTDREEMEGYIRYTPRVRTDPSAVEFSVHNPGGQEAFAYFPVWSRRFSPGQIYVNDKFVQADLRYRKNTIVPLGTGEFVTVTLELGESPTRIAEQFFYTLDDEPAAHAANLADSRSAVFTHFGDSYVEGKINAPADGALVTTFPQDRGWRIWVDGKRINPLSFADVFLAVELSAGSHTFAMQYRPEGFVAGCILSFLSAFFAIAYWFRKKILPKGDPK